MYIVAVLQLGEGTGGGSFLNSIPHDPAAIFLYILIAVSSYLIWRGSHKKTK